jgi:serine/threonine protein phosphatase PrpC
MLTHYMFGKTHVGKTHADNQDEIVIRKITRVSIPNEIYLIGVADGISRSSYGGSVARWLVRNHFECDAIFLDAGTDIGNQFEAYLHGIHAQFLKEFGGMPDMLSSGASLSMACLWDEFAICLWAGDCPVFMTVPQGRELTTRQISIPDTHRVSHELTDCFGAHMPFSIKRRELTVPHGGILTITSDGAQSDEFTLNDLYGRMPVSPTCMQDVIDTALKYPKCDDVSIVACKRE